MNKWYIASKSKTTLSSLENPVYEYFIKDHLGNTRAVVAIGEDGMDTLQTTDFYPFGMIMGGRNEQPGKEDNKYLFGCKELLNAFGSFSIYYFGARDYDARLGRWHVIDPKAEKYCSFSTYNYVLNNPLLLVDPNGEDIYIYYKDEEGKRQRILYIPGMKYDGDNQFVAKTINNFHKVFATDGGKLVLDRLTQKDALVKVKQAQTKFGTKYNFNTNTLKYNANAEGGKVEGGAYNALAGLTHELRHGYQDAQGAYPSSFKKEAELEKDAVNFTNYMRSAYDMGSMRKTYRKYYLRFSRNESTYNPYGEKIEGFNIQQNYLNGVQPGFINIGNSNADNTRITLYNRSVKTGQNLIYRKIYNSTGEIINVNQQLK